jgi:hypothetical protein
MQLMQMLQENAGRESVVFGGRRALMTNIQQFNIWMEVKLSIR